MTKVTVEMLRRLEAACAACHPPADDWMVRISELDLRALTALCRRVKRQFTEAARAVLASLTQGEGESPPA